MGYRKITNKRKKQMSKRNRRGKKTVKRRIRRGGVAPPSQQPQQQQSTVANQEQRMRSPPRSPERARAPFMEPGPVELDMGDISYISETDNVDNFDSDIANVSFSFENDEQLLPRTGGKKKWGARITRRKRKQQGHKYIGGANVGCNNTDPNYSIYNTNMLQLFPYSSN
jgi:hypothetical protein